MTELIIKHLNVLSYGQALSSAAAREYGGDTVEGHEAGDDCAAWAVEKGIPVSSERQAAAGASRLGAEEVQDVHLCEWMLLARAQCEPHPRPLSRRRGE